VRVPTKSNQNLSLKPPQPGTLTEEVTIDDPGAYTRPFTITSSHRILLNEDLIEYVCNENEKDTKHLRGPATRP